MAIGLPYLRLNVLGHMGNMILFSHSSRIYFLAYVIFQKKKKEA